MRIRMPRISTLLLGLSLAATGCGDLFGSTKSDADPGECRPSKDRCGWLNGCNDVDGVEYSCESGPDGCGGTSKRCVAKRRSVQDDLAPIAPRPPNPPADPPPAPPEPPAPEPGVVTYQKIE